MLSAGEFLGLGAHSGAGSEDGAWGNASPGNMCAGKQGLHPSCLSGHCQGAVISTGRMTSRKHLQNFLFVAYFATENS